jgi:hypothetical protein
LKLPFHGNPELDEQFDVKLYEHSRSGSASIPKICASELGQDGTLVLLGARSESAEGCRVAVRRRFKTRLPRGHPSPPGRAGTRPASGGPVEISGAQGLAVELAAKPDACKIDAVGS